MNMRGIFSLCQRSSRCTSQLILVGSAANVAEGTAVQQYMIPCRIRSPCILGTTGSIECTYRVDAANASEHTHVHSTYVMIDITRPEYRVDSGVYTTAAAVVQTVP